MSFEALLKDLDSPDWAVVCDALERARQRLRIAAVGDVQVPILIERLSLLGVHPKWEVRRAVAATSAHSRDPRFDALLDTLRSDANRLVREAAGRAAGRRQRWPVAHAFARQHANHVDTVLDDIEARYGAQGRAAVRRAAEKMLSIFTREVYHEVVKLLSSLATSAERLGDLVEAGPSPMLQDEVRRIEQRVEHVQEVLAAMRTYASQPRLEFADDDIRSIVVEAIAVVRDRARPFPCPNIEVAASDPVRAEVVRTRLMQAMSAILDNAVEACESTGGSVHVSISVDDRRVSIRVHDSGVGMSVEGISEARALFATTKPGGTGFGLPLAIMIVESELDGTLAIDSVRGAGTTVELVFPRRRPGATRG